MSDGIGGQVIEYLLKEPVCKDLIRSHSIEISTGRGWDVLTAEASTWVIIR